MTPERWQQVNDLFLAVIELEPSQRAAFLDQTCADDPALRREVESLVASDDRGCSLIEQAAVEVVAPLLADERPQLAQGQTVSHYEVLSLIGRGGMGEVYLALDKQLNRRVALKVLPIDYTRNRDRLRRFQQEAQAASALNHPNILTIHELGEIEGQQFIATEFVDGETLRDRMNSRPLPINEALDLAIQVAGALEAAHKAGIVHRDVKPENIMVRSDGYVKVLDFGLAKLTEQTAPTTSKSDTAPGLVLGTAKYMSPEQARGLEVDPRSDIFSLCVVLYEMLTGSAPFEGDTVSDLLAAILKDDPPPLIERVTGCPERLEGIIRKGLSKDRSERYISIPILLEDLRSLKEEVEIQSKLEGERRKGSDLAFADSSSAAAITWPRSISSSAEFLIGEMKQHKSLTGLAMATLFITTLSLGYVSYRFFARNAPK